MYTVFDWTHDLVVYGRGLSAVEAMDVMLTHDGYRYEIRPEPDGRGWGLWRSDGSANSPRGARHMRLTRVFSLEDDEDAAIADIAARVIQAAWPRVPSCVTDEDFDAMMAEASAPQKAGDGR